MKIGVMSNTPRTGKSTVLTALAYTYSRTQKKQVAIFSTGSLESLVKPILRINNKDSAASAGVFRALLETRSLTGNQLFDYAIRGGRDEVFIFDLFDRTKDQSKALDFLHATLDTIRSEMVLVKICGSHKLSGNKLIMDSCDVILNVFNPDMQSINEVVSYAGTLTEAQKRKTIFVCNSLDDRILSEKKVTGMMRKNPIQFSTVYYTPGMIKLFMDGDYSAFADKILTGHEELMQVRGQLEKLMQVLYDDGKRKRIIPIKDWDIR